MAHYVDGFVIAVPKRNLDAYRKIARRAAKVWIELGALEVRECVQDDVPRGKVTDFHRSVQAKRGEVVVFSWIIYKSRAQRDRINKKVMEDPWMVEQMESGDEPFDPSRMIYGGFKTVVEADA